MKQKVNEFEFYFISVHAIMLHKEEATGTDAKISKQTQSIISHCTQFSAKPIGPVHVASMTEK